MELEKTILMTSSGLVAIGSIGLLYATHRLYQTLNELKENMTIFLDHYIAYAAPRIKTPEDARAIIELGQTRARTGL